MRICRGRSSPRRRRQGKREGERGLLERRSIHSRGERVTSVECVPFNIAEHYISFWLLSLRYPCWFNPTVAHTVSRLLFDHYRFSFSQYNLLATRHTRALRRLGISSFYTYISLYTRPGKRYESVVYTCIHSCLLDCMRECSIFEILSQAYWELPRLLESIRLTTINGSLIVKLIILMHMNCVRFLPIEW